MFLFLREQKSWTRTNLELVHLCSQNFPAEAKVGPLMKKILAIAQGFSPRINYCVVYFGAKGKTLKIISCWNSKKRHGGKLVKLCKYVELLKSMVVTKQFVFNSHHFSRSKNDVLFLL